MGKKQPKRENVFFKKHNIRFEEKVEELPVYVLLKIGKEIASTDFAVRFYHKKNHKKFYKNKRELLRTIRRSYAIGAFEHREQVEEIVEDYLESI